MYLRCCWICKYEFVANLRCGWIYKYEFVVNLPVSLSAKEFKKLVNIWGSYRQEFIVLFF